MSKSSRIIVRIEPLLKFNLMARCKDDDRSESYIIRQAIIAYLSKAPLDIGDTKWVVPVTMLKTGGPEDQWK